MQKLVAKGLFGSTEGRGGERREERNFTHHKRVLSVWIPSQALYTICD